MNRMTRAAKGLSPILQRNYSTSGSSGQAPFKAGVLLCGCGHMDGTDVTEAVSTLVALSKYNFDIQPIGLPFY